MSTQKINNPLTCDPGTGICDVPATDPGINTIKKKPLRLVYFTDPICSSCWGIEPQLRKLKLVYGQYFDIEYRMGGLLESWDKYGGSDVGKPSDVARHWDEVSAVYNMPMDGDIWLEDPLHSSYPPSIAFKAAQIQDEDKSVVFLRRIREMVFLQKKNIAKWSHLQKAAEEAGLDLQKFAADLDGGAKQIFDEDLSFAKSLGVRGFPTIFFMDDEQNRLKIYGVKPYQHLEQTLLSLYPNASRSDIDRSYVTLFSHYPTLTTKEFSLLMDISFGEAESLLTGLHKNEKVERYQSKNGSLWTLTN